MTWKPNEYYIKAAKGMSKMKTMAFQISEEFFQRSKTHLMWDEQTYDKKFSRSDFVLGVSGWAMKKANEKLKRFRLPRKNLKKLLSRRKNRQRLVKRNTVPAVRREKHGQKGLFSLPV